MLPGDVSDVWNGTAADRNWSGLGLKNAHSAYSDRTGAGLSDSHDDRVFSGCADDAKRSALLAMEPF